MDMQKSMSELYMRAASDVNWLYAIMKPLIQHDELLSALWEVYMRVAKASPAQDVTCGIFRSDYMLHLGHTDATLKQVEMNTFSVAGACHAEKVVNMHRHLHNMHAGSSSVDLRRLPSNTNLTSIVHCLAAAHKLYRPSSDRPLCILMVVQPFNFNIADERPIEYGLWEAGVPCYRCDWRDIMERTTLTEDRTLLYRPGLGKAQLEVSVVYYRAGYDSREYDQAGQLIRITLELARAIKCPDVLTHITTFKTVQQALTEPGVVDRFLPAVSADKVRRTFMPMMALDESPAGLSARAIAMDPQRAIDYVLKPNLEGGGHNIYRADISAFLMTVPHHQWHRYVLMRIIEPPVHTTGLLMTQEELYQGAVISELGVLGACIWQKTESNDGSGLEILKNDLAGWTFKTKPSDIDEMSVVKGYGCFDCPSLQG